jgi:hypothetical protein
MADSIRQDPTLRVSFQAPVTLTLHRPPGEQRLRTRNLGTGGLFVRSDHPLPEQSLVQVRLTLPEGGEVRGPARVVRAVAPEDPSEPGGMALCFDELCPDTALSLERFVAQELGLEDAPTLLDLEDDEELDPVYTEEYLSFSQRELERRAEAEE